MQTTECQKRVFTCHFQFAVISNECTKVFSNTFSKYTMDENIGNDLDKLAIMMDVFDNKDDIMMEMTHKVYF